MKKTRLIALVMVVALAVSLMSSCSIFGGNDLKDLIDDKATYASKAPASSSTSLPSLTGYEYVKSEGDLALFSNSDSDMYMVYNVATGNSVKTVSRQSSSATTTVSVDLHGFGERYGDASYFTVMTQNYVSSTGTTSYMTSYMSELYDASGALIKSVSKNVYPHMVFADILEFDGNYYRSKDGALVSAFSYSPLADLPDIVEFIGGYYLEINGEVINAYDQDLNSVASYRFPEYADVFCLGELPDSRILIQYSYAVDIVDDKYDLIDDDGTKFNLVTLIFDIEKDKVKEIDCDYVIDYINATSEEDLAEYGVNADRCGYVVFATKIENDRLAYEITGSIDKNGKIKEFPQINGEYVEYGEAVASGVWLVETDSREYLIDAEGEIIGEISNASTYGKYLVADEKIYDYKLNMLYDFGQMDYEIARTVGENIVFTDSEGGYILYTGGSSIQTIKGGNDINKSVTFSGNIYAVTTNYGSSYQLDIYNENGQSIQAIPSSGNISFSRVYSDDDLGTIISVSTTVSGNTTINYYLVK